MKKTIVYLGLILAGTHAWASADYAGTWCRSFPDFTEVLMIDSQDRAASYSIGMQEGEATPLEVGYVSRGATAFQINLSGEDMGVEKYKVRKQVFGKQKVLVLTYKDGTKIKYKQCAPINE